MTARGTHRQWWAARCGRKMAEAPIPAVDVTGGEHVAGHEYQEEQGYTRGVYRHDRGVGGAAGGPPDPPAGGPFPSPNDPPSTGGRARASPPGGPWGPTGNRRGEPGRPPRPRR